MKVEPSGFVLWKFLAQMVGMLLCIAILFGSVFDYFNLSPSSSSDKLLEVAKSHPYLFFLGMLPVFAIIEEFIFRLPLALLVRKNAKDITLVFGTLFLSLFFGLAHGGWVGVPIQGVMGIIFCIVFLKCGGLGKKYGKALFCGTIVHFSYNVFAFGGNLLFG